MPDGSDTIGSAWVAIRPDTAAFEGLLTRGLSGPMQKAEGMFGNLGKVAIGAVVGIGGAAAATGLGLAKMAGDFQLLMTQVVTGAGESQANLKMVSDGILKMAGDVGQMPDALAKGIYNIESAGYHGAQALNVLRASAEGAKVGGADMATVADALTTAMNAYHLPATAAVSVTNDLIRTVSLGKTHLGDLAGAMGAVLPIASALHVPLAEVSGAMATMTLQGTDAGKAAQSLRFLIAALSGPTPKAAAEMKALGVGMDKIPGLTKSVSKSLTDMGLDSSKVAYTITHQGLQAALEMVTDAIGKKFPPGSAAYQAALAGAVGGTRGLTAALELTGQNLPVFEQNVKDVTTAANDGSGAVKGWALTQEDFNTKLEKAKAAVTAAGISIGTMLLPYLSQAADWLGKNLPGAIDKLGTWIRTVAIPDLQKFGQWMGTNVIGPLVKAGQVVLPPFIAALGFVTGHLKDMQAPLEAVAGLMAGMWAVNKIGGWVSAATGAIQKVLGIGGGSGLPGGIGVQKVWVVNMPAGGPGGSPGGGPGGSPGGNAIPLAAGATIFAGQMNTANTLQNGGAVLPGGPFGMSIPGLTSAMPAGGGAFGNLSDLFTKAQTGGMFGGVDTAKAEADLNAAMKNIHDLPGFTSMTVDQMKGIEEAVRDGKITSQADLLDYLRQMGVLNDTISLAVGQANGIPPQLAQYVATSGLANKSGKDFQGGVEALAQQTGESINQIISAYTVTTGFSKDVAAESDKDFRKVRDLYPNLADLVTSTGLASKSGAAFSGAVQSLALQSHQSINDILSAYALTAGFANNMVGYQQQINGILAAGVTLASGVEAKIGSIRGSAGGNDFPAGGLSWVGEKGKELVALPAGSRVIPHGESLNLAQRSGNSNGNNVTIYQNLTINGGDPAQVQAIIHQEFRSLELSLRAQ